MLALSRSSDIVQYFCSSGTVMLLGRSQLSYLRLNDLGSFFIRFLLTK